MKKYIFSLILIGSFNLANGMGAADSFTIYCKNQPVIISAIGAETLDTFSPIFGDSLQTGSKINISAEIFDFIIACYKGIEDWSDEEQCLALEDRLSGMDNNQLEVFMDAAKELALSALYSTAFKLSIAKNTTQAKEKTEKSLPEGSEMELLEFKGKTEADITKMVGELMLEALPGHRDVACLDDLSAAKAQEEMESWERITPAEALEKQVKFMSDLSTDPRKRLTRIFRLILQQSETPLFIDDNDTDRVIPKESLRELDVLVGSGTSDDHKEHSLAKNISHTKMHIGYATLMRHLAQVKTPSNLKALTATLGKLNETKGNHLPLGNEIRLLLEKLAPIEDTFISFWSPEEGWPDPLVEAIQKQLTAHRPKAARKSKEIQAFKDNPSFKNYRAAYPFIASKEFDALNYSTWYMQFRQTLKFGWGPIASLFGTGAGIGLAVTAAGPVTIPLAAAGGLALIGGAGGMIDQHMMKLMGLYLMQKKLYGVATFVKTIKRMQDILKAHQFPQKLIDQLNLPISDQEFAQLEELLNNEAFNTEKRVYKHYGKILVAYRLMGKKRNGFLKAYMAIGSLDMLASLNKLLASSTSEKPYCLAQFGTTKSGIQATACWSPLLEGQSVVTNDVALGGQSPSTHIITGPNARGKTTLMRSVGGAALLGSTLGIGSAESLTIPPNLEFITSVNIGDDPFNQLSLFQSLVRRMAQVMTTLEQRRREGRPCLLIADEPFVGTDNTVSEVCASTFIEEVAQMNPLALFSSHLKVSHLAKQHSALIANFHLNSYHLLPGIDTDRERYLDIAVGEISSAFGSPDHPFVKKIRAALLAKMHAGSATTEPSVTRTADAEPSIRTGTQMRSVGDEKTPACVIDGTRLAKGEDFIRDQADAVIARSGAAMDQLEAAVGSTRDSVSGITAAASDATAIISGARASISDAADRIKRSADTFERVERIKRDKLREWQGAIQEWVEHGHIGKEQFPSLITDYFRFAAILSLNPEETAQAIAGLQRLLALPVTDQSDSDSDDEPEKGDNYRLQNLVRSRVNELRRERRQTKDHEERSFLRQQIKDTQETFRRLTELSESSSDDE